MTEKYEYVKLQCIRIRDYVFARPKMVYTYLMGFLILSFSFPFVQYYFVTPKPPKTFSVPNLYSESDRSKSDFDKKEQLMENVVIELQRFKRKRENGPLTKNDSLRIEYLYNQYQHLKNGH